MPQETLSFLEVLADSADDIIAINWEDVAEEPVVEDSKRPTADSMRYS
jgi:hypothetical protein